MSSALSLAMESPEQGGKWKLFMVEFGHQSFGQLDTVRDRFFATIAIIIRSSHYDDLRYALSKLRAKYLSADPTYPPILAHGDIVNRRGPFRCLAEDAYRRTFYEALESFFSGQEFRILIMLMDKKQVPSEWRRAKHPRLICFERLLERYGDYLHILKAKGDVTAVSASKSKDDELSHAYKRVRENGTLYRQRYAFTGLEKELNLKRWDADIAGIQVVSVLTHASVHFLLERLELGIPIESIADLDEAVLGIVRQKVRHERVADLFGWYVVT